MTWEILNFSNADAQRMIGKIYNNDNEIFANIIREIISQGHCCPTGTKKINLTEFKAKLENTILSFTGRASSIGFTEYLLGRVHETNVNIDDDRVAELVNDLFNQLDNN